MADHDGYSDVGSESSPQRRDARNHRAASLHNQEGSPTSTPREREKKYTKSSRSAFQSTYTQPVHNHRFHQSSSTQLSKLSMLQRKAATKEDHLNSRSLLDVETTEAEADHEVEVSALEEPEVVPSDVMEKLEIALAERAVLVESLSNERTAKQKLQAKAKTADTQSKATQLELQRIKSRLTTLEKTANKGKNAAAEIERLQFELHERDDDYQVLRADYVRVEGRMKGLEANLGNKKKLETALGTQRVKSEGQTLQQWDRRINTLSTEIEELEQRLHALNSGEAELSGGHQHHQATHTTGLNDFASIENMVASKKRDEMQRINDEMQRANDALEKEAKQLDAEEKKVQASLNSVLANVELAKQSQQRSIAEVNKNQTSTKTSIADAEKQTKKCGIQVHEVQQECRELEQELSGLTARSRRLRTQIQESVAAGSELPKIEAAAWEQEKAATQSKIQSQQKRISDLESEKKKLQGSLADMKGRQKTQEDLQQRRSKLHQEVLAMREKEAAAGLKVEQIQKQLAEVRKEISLSQKDNTIADLQKKEETINGKVRTVQDANKGIEAALKKAVDLLEANGFSLD